MLADITSLFERDLNRLSKEIQSYNDEGDIWRIKDGISNSAGTLVLHLVGNLNHFFGAGVLNSGYIRDREKEFSDRNIPREKLVKDIGDTMALIKTALSSVSKESLEKDFPFPLNNAVISTQLILVHLYGHLNYHLGQVNYHRRLIS